jgi:hypothetical protein
MDTVHLRLVPYSPVHLLALIAFLNSVGAWSIAPEGLNPPAIFKRPNENRATVFISWGLSSPNI